MSLALIPLGDRVLIRPQKNPEFSAAGLHLPEHRKPETAGWIASLGETANKEALRVGDYVLFSWQSGQELYVNDERLLMMREQDVLAVVEEALEPQKVMWEGIPVFREEGQ